MAGIDNVLADKAEVSLSFGKVEIRKVTLGDIAAMKKWLKQERINGAVLALKESGMPKEAVTAAMQISRQTITDTEMEEAMNTIEGADFLLNRISGEADFSSKLSMDDVPIVINAVMPEAEESPGEPQPS